MSPKLLENLFFTFFTFVEYATYLVESVLQVIARITSVIFLNCNIGRFKACNKYRYINKLHKQCQYINGRALGRMPKPQGEGVMMAHIE